MSDPRIFHVSVTQVVKVTLDADKFDGAFMEEFRAGFYPFTSLEDHAEHIAQLQAREMIEATKYSSDFIEGYGESRDMGIIAETVETEIEVLK